MPPVNGQYTVNETMNASIVEGVQYFTLLFNCTDAGGGGVLLPTSLPDTGIFVINIIDPADPTKDTFARVVEIADFATYSTNRGIAFSRGDTLYRASSTSKSYTDFEVAVAAKAAFHDRFNQLGEDWENYSVDFMEAGTDGYYPASVVPDSAIKALADTYYTSYEDYLSDLNDQSTGWLATKNAYDVATQKVTDYGYFKGLLTTFKSSYMNSVNSFYATLNNAITGYFTSLGAISTYYSSTLLTQLNNFYTSVTGFAAIPGGAARTQAVLDWENFVTKSPDVSTTLTYKYFNVSVSPLIALYSSNISPLPTSYTSIMTPIATHYDSDLLNIISLEYSNALSAQTTAYNTLKTKWDELNASRAAAVTAKNDLLAVCSTFEEPRGYELAALPPVPAMP